MPVLGNEAGITIRLQESVKQRVTETRYEILVFVDYKFLTEIEEGCSPAKMNINTFNLTEGEHILTVNLVTLQGGLATVSKRFIKSEYPSYESLVESCYGVYLRFKSTSLRL